MYFLCFATTAVLHTVTFSSLDEPGCMVPCDDQHRRAESGERVLYRCSLFHAVRMLGFQQKLKGFFFWKKGDNFKILIRNFDPKIQTKDPNKRYLYRIVHRRIVATASSPAVKPTRHRSYWGPFYDPTQPSSAKAQST